MTTQRRRHIAAALDLYIPGGIVFGILSILDQYLGIYFDLFLGGGLMWGVVLIKDIFEGQSISKKIFGLQVVNKDTQEPIKPIRSILRNFASLPLFPVELIYFFVSGKRISDHIFKTEVIDTDRMNRQLILAQLRKVGAMDYLKYFVMSYLLAVAGLILYDLIWMKSIELIFLSNSH